MGIKISRVLHAGYVFETSKVRIIFDPIFENPFSKNCFSFPAINFSSDVIGKQRFDAVFISHFHDDHCSLKSLDLISRDTPIYLFCIDSSLPNMIRRLGFKEVHPLSLGRGVLVGDLLVTPLRALDADIDCLFHVNKDDLNVLNVVDSWIDPEIFESLKKISWDLILWPFQTMQEMEVLSPKRFMVSDQKIPSEHIEQLTVLSPRYLIASACQFIHEEWSWYRKFFFPISYESFFNQLRDIAPNTEGLRLEPGESRMLTNQSFLKSEPLEWIETVETEVVDYVYNPEVLVPTTSDVAKNFQALSEEQKKTVEDFCRKRILEIYQKLDPEESFYFLKSRVWCLKTYDHLGKATVHSFLIKNNQIEILQEESSNYQWLTEVPESRLWGSLERGETITSMYLRINDHSFDGELEKELEETSIFEDPLIRVLSSFGNFSYQEAQLKYLLRF